jgi:hypothetical protein
VSYVEVFAVDKDGDVLSHSTDARNNHVFAPLVWDLFGKKYGYFAEYPFPSSRDDGLAHLWREWPSPKMTRAENILLGATFDRVWIRRALLPELVSACEDFLAEYIRKPAPPSRFDKPGDPPSFYDDRAVVGIIAALKEILQDESNIGAAFNCCSANEAFWRVRDVDSYDCTTCEGGFVAMFPCPDCKGDQKVEYDSEDEWESRPWNVNKDETQPSGEDQGKGAWELSERMEVAQ